MENTKNTKNTSKNASTSAGKSAGKSVSKGQMRSPAKGSKSALGTGQDFSAEAPDSVEVSAESLKDAPRRERLPLYASTGRRSPVIILAVDADALPTLDSHVQRYVKKNFSVVVLVGDRFNAEPLVPSVDGTVEVPQYIGKISAQPAWHWCADNLPFARDVVFIAA